MYHKHHIIPRHEWKVRFGNLQGFNAPDNVVILTTEQHAQAHFLLYELNKNQYDFIAAEALSGQIGKEEAMRRAWKLRGAPRPKGFIMTRSHRMAISKASMGKPGTRKGVVLSVQTRTRMKSSLRNLPKLTCPHCTKTGAYCAMKQHHFNNCKVGV